MPHKKSARNRIAAILLLAALCPHIAANEQTGAAAGTGKNHVFEAGAGLGLDYGGLFGVQAAYILPWPHVSVFAAAGMQLFGFGWNTGIKLHILPESDRYFVRPNVKLMYGINRSMIMLLSKDDSKLYAGFTPGVGCEIMFGKDKTNGFDIDLNLPVGSADFNRDIQELKDRGGAVTMYPVALSLGYHREF